MITIALDGYAGTGKSSTAREVAHRLAYTYIDTGAMYRAVTLYLLDHDVPMEDHHPALQEALSRIHLAFAPAENGDLQIHLNGVCAEPAIRERRVTEAVSHVATLTDVRHQLVAQQRNIGASGGVVMDGRDIGTYVFPHAELKVFMTASIEIRARRREEELHAKGIFIPFDDIVSNLRERDYIDSHREMAPLQQADDAVVIDTTKLSFEEQVEQVVLLAREKINS